MLFLLKFLINVVFLFGLIASCTKEPQTLRKQRSNNSNDGAKSASNVKKAEQKDTLQITDPKLLKLMGKYPQKRNRNKKVSTLDLDDNAFLVRRFTVGLQTFMRSETPVLNYEIPEDADYVQIYRCPLKVVLEGESSSIKLEDLEIGTGMSTDERDIIYRNNDFLKMAIKAGCSNLSMGTTKPKFADSWCPSGNHRYLVTACVASERLTDTDSDNRECSRQVAVSGPQKDFVNKRMKLQQELLAKANEASAIYDQAASHLKYLAESLRSAWTVCEEREYKKAVAKARKVAITRLTAVALDVFIELKTAQLEKGESLASHYLSPNPMKNSMDKMQLIGAAEGYSFNVMFQELAKAPQDWPKSCAKGIALDKQMSAAASTFPNLLFNYRTFKARAMCAKAVEAAAGGEVTADDIKQNPCDQSGGQQ